MTHGHDPYFFSQKKNRRFQKRLRKPLDDYSLYGDRKETLLTFRGGWDAESVVSGGSRWRRPSSATIRPGTATRRVSINQPQLVLPAVDPTGPKLVAAEPILEAVETRSTFSEKKVDFLLAVEKEDKTKPPEKGQKYKLSEAKFASSSILSNLSKLLFSISEVSIPVELVNIILQDYQQLTADIVPEKREWQTDCYLDFEPKNKKPFLTAVPEEEHLRAELESSVKKVAKKQLKERNKRVRVNRESMLKKHPLDSSPDRPQTARSVLSNYSVHSDFSHSSMVEDREEYDMLPVELRPTILHYRRESAVPKIKSKGPKTRLEKFKSMQRGTKKDPGAKKRVICVKPSEKLPEEDEQEEEPEPSALHHIQGTTMIINFSMGSSDCQDKGWLVTPSETEDPEANTLRIWEKQIKELMRRREEAKLIAKQRGEDGPLVVKYYNDPQIRTVRMKHQRSATFPLPAVFSKLPPSVASFMLPSANEALLIGEGLKVFVLVLPDGSTCCNYYSGRQAVCATRSGDLSSKGLYTVVYDDTEDNTVLGYFTPTGRACCYYRSGRLHMLSDPEGGRLFDEDGNVTRKWVWPPPNNKLPVSVSIQLNAHLSFQCSSLSSMILRFSSRGQNHKFLVGPPPDFLEEHREPGGDQPDQLLTDTPFSSRTAHSCRQKSQTEEIQISLHPPSTRTRRLLRGRMHSVASEDEEGPNLLINCDHLSKDLSSYKDKIRGIVNDWMAHYRHHIGISLPTHLAPTLPHSSSSSLLSWSVSAQGRRIQSSKSYAGETYSHPPTRSDRARRFTHPFSSPCTSPPGELRSRSPLLANLAVSEASRVPSPCFPPPASPLDFIQRPPSAEPCKPFKVGTSKPQRKTSSRLKCGCPVALHNMLLRDLDTMPPCKCDKRRPPYISDLEYDIFLQSHVPKDQLLIVCIVSSIVENSCPCEPMLDAIHYGQNRVRFSPCTQCASDVFRLVKYDLCRACKGLNRVQPMLVERHNAAPGMFLMYLGGRLVHADYMFNGYGTTKRDFMKQIQQCMEGGRKGHFLPSDFKFSRRTGTKIPGGSTWAYPLAGVLEDLVPFTPADSHSGSSSQQSFMAPEGSRMSMTAESKLTMDYLGFSTGDVLQLSVCSGLESFSQVSNLSASAVSVRARES